MKPAKTSVDFVIPLFPHQQQQQQQQQQLKATTQTSYRYMGIGMGVGVANNKTEKIVQIMTSKNSKISNTKSS